MRKLMRAYLIDAICSDDDVELANPDAKVKYFRDCFHDEFGHEIRRKGEREALEQYLRGLPSCINVAFNYHDIIEIGVKWGKIKHDPRPEMSFAESRFCQRWWGYMAYNLLQLFGECAQ